MSHSTPAIELRSVGVRYTLHRERVYSLKETMIGRVRASLGRAEKAGHKSQAEEFWAIRNATFDVLRGQSLALTGRNGAGKSTLLKVISGVLHPSEGEMWVRGRVSAMIELGAGFVPQLTGRENIFLGASVAGFSRKQTLKFVDKIIEFSELQDFIDLPIQNYSSGMQARLGFSVATEIDPDLLVVDEILSVGDAPFQKKCLERMNSFRKRNKTILYVSHSVGSIQDFCDTVVEIEKGRMVSGPRPIEQWLADPQRI